MTLPGEELFPPQPQPAQRDWLKLLIPLIGAGFTLIAVIGFAVAWWLHTTAKPADDIAVPSTVEDLFTYDIPAEFLVATESDESEITALLAALETEPAASTATEVDLASQLSPTAENLPRWQRNRAPAPAVPAGFAQIAIIIDDLGVNAELSARILQFPPQLTLAFLPYGTTSLALAERGKTRGSDILVHLPMEAVARANGSTIDPGPNALFTSMTAAQISATTQSNLADYLELAIGANNHMGSALTADASAMHAVLQVLADNELMFVDSLTTNRSQVSTVAADFPQLPLLKRNVFLDHDRDEVAIERQFQRLIALAQKNGSAIGIGHPYPQTYAVLERLLPTLTDQNIALVPLSALVPADD